MTLRVTPLLNKCIDALRIQCLERVVKCGVSLVDRLELSEEAAMCAPLNSEGSFG